MTSEDRRDVPFRFNTEVDPEQPDIFVSQPEHLAGYGLVVIEARRNIWTPDTSGFAVSETDLAATIVADLGKGKPGVRIESARKLHDEGMYAFRILNQPNATLPPAVRPFVQVFIDGSSRPDIFAPLSEVTDRPNFSHATKKWQRSGINLHLFLPRDPTLLSRLTWAIEHRSNAPIVEVRTMD